MAPDSLRRRLQRPVRQRVSIAAYQVRRQIGRMDNPEVRRARRLARLSRKGKLDVLYLGDSATSFIAPYDSDRRPLHAMIRDNLTAFGQFHTVCGGSYNPPLYSGYLRQVVPDAPPPLVIMPLCARVHTAPWIEHPVYGHKRAAAFLRNVDSSTPLRRIRLGLPLAGPDEWEQFYAVPHPTWAGELKIGEYVRRLKQAPERDEDRARLLYAYHHGGEVQCGASLEAVTNLGRELRDRDVRVVVYQTPVPVEKGEELYGPRFRELARDNFAKLDAAFTKGYGDIGILQTGTTFSTAEFIDWYDGSEHLNQVGRLRLAEEIGVAARAALGAHVGGDARA